MLLNNMYKAKENMLMLEAFHCSSLTWLLLPLVMNIWGINLLSSLTNVTLAIFTNVKFVGKYRIVDIIQEITKEIAEVV